MSLSKSLTRINSMKTGHKSMLSFQFHFSFSNAKPVRRKCTEAVTMCKEYHISGDYKSTQHVIGSSSPPNSVASLTLMH